MRSLIKKTFKREISKGTVAVLFHSELCHFCKLFLPEFKSAENKYSKIKFAEYNLNNKNNFPLDDCYIGTIPTVILFKNGKEIARESAVLGVGLSKNKFKDLMRKV